MVAVSGDPVGPEGEDGVGRDLGDDRGELVDRVLARVGDEGAVEMAAPARVTEEAVLERRRAGRGRRGSP